MSANNLFLVLLQNKIIKDEPARLSGIKTDNRALMLF